MYILCNRPRRLAGYSCRTGLPEDFIGYDLKTLCSENGHDLGLLYRTEIVNYIMEDCNGLIGASTGVKKDGRVTIVE